MDLIASLYPPLSERRPFPALYLPVCFLLNLVPFLSSDRRLGVLFTLPILLLLCFRAPFYTFGSPSADYYNSGPFLAMLLWYLDFVILSPSDGPDAPIFIGNPSTTVTSETSLVHDRLETRSALQKLGWAFRLMIPSHRGIGWNWQVKSVPPVSNVKFSKRAYVMLHLERMIWRMYGLWLCLLLWVLARRRGRNVRAVRFGCRPCSMP
jgi:hypothetical protein